MPLYHVNGGAFSGKNSTMSSSGGVYSSRQLLQTLRTRRWESTPTSELPICVASRIRCDSPPDSVAAVRSSDR